MSHRIGLSLYRTSNPNDPRVELFSRDDGFIMRNMGGFNSVQLDSATNRPIRTLTFDFAIIGVTRQDALNKTARVHGLLQRTRLYLDRFKGNYPESTNGTWQEGRAATLSVWLDELNEPVFYDVLSGSIALSDGFMGVDFGSNTVVCTLTIICRANPRTTQRTLCNEVAGGDQAPPFSVYDNAFTCGYSYGTLANWSVTSETAWWGNRSLLWYGSGSDTCYTNASSALIPGDVLVPACMVRCAATLTGTVVIALQVSPDGSSWSTAQTLATLPTLPAGAPLQPLAWAPVEGVSYTVPASGVVYARLAITISGMGAGTGLYFNGLAIWRNPVNGHIPREYVTGGYQLGVPYFTVYNTAGDTEAPIQLGVYPNSTSFLGNKTYIGAHDIDTDIDLPLYAFDLRATAPILRETFNGVYNGFTESNHILTVAQGMFASANGAGYSVSDTNGDAIYADVGTQRYTATLAVAGTLNSATNYRVPQIVIGIPSPTTAHIRIYLQNGLLHMDSWNDTGTLADGHTVSTTTTDGTGYVLSVQRFYNSGSYKCTISVNGTALISSYTFGISGAVAPKTGIRFAKGGSPATAATWDSWMVTPESGLTSAPGELAQLANSIYMFGNVAAKNVTNSSTSVTFPLNGGANVGRRIDRTHRPYFAAMAYMNTTPASAVGNMSTTTLTVNNETATFPLAQVAGYNAGGFVLVPVGDFQFGRPGVMWQDLIERLDDTRSSVFVDHANLNSTGYTVEISGIILLPAQQFAVVESPVKSYGFRLFNSGEVAQAGNFDIANTFGTTTHPESVVPHNNMAMDAGDFTLTPSLGQRTRMTRFEIMPTFDKTVADNTYFNTPEQTYRVALYYEPRYSLGVA